MFWPFRVVYDTAYFELLYTKVPSCINNVLLRSIRSELKVFECSFIINLNPPINS